VVPTDSQASPSPQSIAAGYAVLGIFLGIVIAFWAAGSRPVAANVLATSAWLWLLAVVAIVTGLRDKLPATGVQLGHWRMTGLGERFYYGTVYWPAALLAVATALLIGAVAAWPAVRRGDRGIGAAASGAVGPLLVAAAYFTLAPQLTGGRGMLESAYLITPYTVLAGLAGSCLVVAWGEKAANRRAVRRQQTSRTAARSQPATEAALSSAGASGGGDRPVVGWLEPNGGNTGRPDPAAVTVDSVFDDVPPARPTAATGRAKLPGPRTESTPPPNTPPGAKLARSTVKPPPEHPTVATINPPRNPDDRPSTAKPGPARPADPKQSPAAPPQSSSAQSSSAQVTPSVQATPKGKPDAGRDSGRTSGPGGSAPSAGSGRSDTSAQPADAKGAPGKGAMKSPTNGSAARKLSRGSKPVPASATGAAPPATGASGPAGSTGAGSASTGGAKNGATAADDPKGSAAKADATKGGGAKGNGPDRAVPAGGGGPAGSPRIAGSGAAAGQGNANGDAAPASAISAALADTTPLWVDDAKQADAEDSPKSRWRRFGRRSESSFDPDTEPPA
jgi:hypothetical protein